MSQNKKAMAMLISAMLIYGTIGIFRRFIPLPSAMLACYRGIVGAVFLIIFVKVKGSFHFSLSKKQWFLLIFSGAMIGVNWILLFESYNYTSIATATLCYYMEPTFVVLVSPFFFKEKLTPTKLVCVLAALFGMCFISGVIPGGLPDASEAKGILFGIGAAALYAAVIVVNKKTPGTDAFAKTIVQLASAGLVLVPYVLVTSDFSTIALDQRAIIMLIIVGLVHTGLAYALYFGSMDHISAQTVALFSYIDPVTALVLSTLILHENMTIYGVIGTVLILGSTFICELRKS